MDWLLHCGTVRSNVTSINATAAGTAKAVVPKPGQHDAELYYLVLTMAVTYIANGLPMMNCLIEYQMVHDNIKNVFLAILPS